MKHYKGQARVDNADKLRSFNELAVANKLTEETIRVLLDEDYTDVDVLSEMDRHSIDKLDIKESQRTRLFKWVQHLQGGSTTAQPRVEGKPSETDPNRVKQLNVSQGHVCSSSGPQNTPVTSLDHSSAKGHDTPAVPPRPHETAQRYPGHPGVVHTRGGSHPAQPHGSHTAATSCIDPSHINRSMATNPASGLDLQQSLQFPQPHLGHNQPRHSPASGQQHLSHDNWGSNNPPTQQTYVPTYDLLGLNSGSQSLPRTTHASSMGAPIPSQERIPRVSSADLLHPSATQYNQGSLTTGIS